MAKQKVLVSLEPALLASLDEAAADRGLNRSEFIAQLLAERVTGTGTLADPPPRLIDVPAQVVRRHPANVSPPAPTPGNTSAGRSTTLAPCTHARTRATTFRGADVIGCADCNQIRLGGQWVAVARAGAVTPLPKR